MDISITLLNKLYFLYGAADSIMHKKHGKFNYFILKNAAEGGIMSVYFIFTPKERYHAG